MNSYIYWRKIRKFILWIRQKLITLNETDMKLDHLRVTLVYRCKTAKKTLMPIVLFFFFKFNSHGCGTTYREPCLLNHLRTQEMTREEDDYRPCANFKTLNTDFGSPSTERKSFMNWNNIFNKKPCDYFPKTIKKKENYK